MLNKTLEFLRIADTQPSDEKVRKRKESAQILLTQLPDNRELLLDLAQGIVAGFGLGPLTQDSDAVVKLIAAIQEKDATLPHDLTENAIELRAVAAIAVGELLTERPHGEPTDQAAFAALAIRSALSSRPAATEKYIAWMLSTLLEYADVVLQTRARLRRQRDVSAQRELAEIEAATSTTDLWTVVVPAVKAALREAVNQAAIDREEIETLWWMFAAYSEIENKPLASLEPVGAAFSAGVELAERALLPPALSASAMIKRAVDAERKETTLGAISLQDSTKHWSEKMLDALAPNDATLNEALSRYPALLPISWGCRRLRECSDGAQKLGKELTVATGIPLKHSQLAAEWGTQVFRERILQRAITETEEN